MVEVKELNLTEILTALQDFMTSDGAISGEQREFYTVFRGTSTATLANSKLKTSKTS